MTANATPTTIGTSRLMLFEPEVADAVGGAVAVTA
jgi:hypothetical protein